MQRKNTILTATWTPTFTPTQPQPGPSFHVNKDKVFVATSPFERTIQTLYGLYKGAPFVSPLAVDKCFPQAVSAENRPSP